MGAFLCYEAAGEKHQYQDKTMSDRLYITEAVDLGGLKVRLVFSDGTDSTVDVGDYIRRHPHPVGVFEIADEVLGIGAAARGEYNQIVHDPKGSKTGRICYSKIY